MLRQEKGITLVALITTVIVLVILAAISISAAYRSGIVNYTVQGAYDYQNAAHLENTIMSKTESELSSVLSEVKSIMSSADAAAD